MVANNSMYYMYIAMYSVYLLHKVVWISYLSEIITFTVTRTRGVFSAYQGMCLNHNFTKFWGEEWPLRPLPFGTGTWTPVGGPRLGTSPQNTGQSSASRDTHRPACNGSMHQHSTQPCGHQRHARMCTYVIRQVPAQLLPNCMYI